MRFRLRPAWLVQLLLPPPSSPLLSLPCPHHHHPHRPPSHQVAGHETTGSVLTWTIDLLARNPEKMRKVGVTSAIKCRASGNCVYGDPPPPPHPTLGNSRRPRRRWTALPHPMPCLEHPPPRTHTHAPLPPPPPPQAQEEVDRVLGDRDKPTMGEGPPPCLALCLALR